MTRKEIFSTLNRVAADDDATRRAQRAIEHRAKHLMKLGTGCLAHAIACETEADLTSRQLSVTVEALLMVEYLESLAIEKNHQRRKLHQ